MLSTLTPFDTLASQIAHYRANLAEASTVARANPGFGKIDIARWVYVAESDAQAKKDSADGLLRHLNHFFGGHQSGYLGQVSQGKDLVSDALDYDTLARSTIIHGSPATVVARIEELKAKTGSTSMMLHYPPWYGTEKAKASLELGISDEPSNAAADTHRLRGLPQGGHPRRHHRRCRAARRGTQAGDAARNRFRLRDRQEEELGADHQTLSDGGVDRCQVAAVVNFPPRQIGKMMSEVLTLGFPDAAGEVVLIGPERTVPNGGRP